jgi:hypothetical protein
MLKTIKATVNEKGEVRLLEPVTIKQPCRAIVMIIEEGDVPDATLLSQQALAQDWDRPEEDEAWAHLQ